MGRRGRITLSIAMSLAMVLGMCPTRGLAEAIEGQPDVEAIVAAESETAPETDDSGDGVQAEAQTAGEQAEYVAEIQHGQKSLRQYMSIHEALNAWKYDSETTIETAALVLLKDCELDADQQITEYEVSGHYRAINLNGHTLDMKGRTLSVTNHTGGTLALEDGVGVGGKLSNCAVVVLGQFIMSGGTLACDSTNSCISFQTASPDIGRREFYMSGGTVTNANGPGVSVPANDKREYTLKVSGTPKIAGSKGGNVCLSAGKVITVAGPLEDGASIGVTTAVKPTAQNPVVEFTSGYGEQNRNDDPSKFFTSDDPDYCVAWNEDKTEAVLVAHKHDWSYVSNDNVLTATCANNNCPAEGGNVQTLTLSAKSKAHDGKAAVATIATSEGWPSTGAAAGDVAYYQGAKRLDGAPVDAGDYEARAAVQTADGEKTVTATFSITRDPAPEPLPATVPASVVAHLQRVGTLPASAGVGQLVGTTGQSRRLESLRLSLAGQPLAGGVEYRAHVQRVGWQGWRADGEMAGTEGRSRRLEAVQLRLTGAMANDYDIFYRVHVQRYGWMAWAKNGKPAGTTGESRRAEAVQIVVQRKGSPAPGATYGGITQTFNKAFEKR